MAYGLSIENPSGKLVLSSDGIIPGYLGKATLSSVTQNDTTNAGFSTYTFSHAGPIIPVVKLQSTRQTFLQSYTQSGSTWTIIVYNGGSPSIDNGFDTQYSTDVYVWGLPVSVSGYGGAIYDGSGNLKGDLLKRPLDIKARIDWDSSTVSGSISGITTPGIIGSLSDWQRAVTGSGTFVVRINAASWNYSSGTLSRSTFSQMIYEPAEDSNYGGSSTVRRAVVASLVDVNGLT